MSHVRKRAPITKLHLRALLAHLHARSAISTCDHSLRRTETFLRCLRVWSDEVREWLEENGAFCDCEVLLNVGSSWTDALSRVRRRARPDFDH